MQRIIYTCLDSISLAGLHGISLPELWTLLENDLQFTVDDYMKNWIWQQIRASKKLEFFLSDKDEPALAKSEIKGMRGCYDPQRKKADEATLNQSIAELNALGNKLRIVMDQDSRDKALGITDPDVFMNDVQYRILELLALARTNGLFQTDLATKLNVDAKTVFFHLKKLEVLGMIVRKSVLRSVPGKPSTKTNIIHLKRFSGESASGGEAIENEGEEVDEDDEDQEATSAKEFIYYSSIEQRVCDMLSGARQNILRESEVGRALTISLGSKKVWPTIRKNLLEDGFIKLFDAKLPDSEELVSCVRLVKPYSTKEEQKGTNASAAETRKAVAELSLDYQIYKFIESSGETGVFKNDIARIINALSRRSLTNKMHLMTTEYDISALPEVRGKQTAYRFILNKFINNESLPHVTSTVLPKELTKRKTPKSTPMKQAALVDESSQADTGSKQPDQPQSEADQTVFSTPKKVTKKGKSTPASKNNTNIASPPSTPAKSTDENSQSDAETATPRRAVITIQNSQRKQVILEELQKHKVILETNMRRVLEERVPSETKIDSKTVKRMVSKMEKDNELKVLNTTVPQMSGAPKKFTLLIMPDLTIESAEVKEVIERLRDSQFVIKTALTPNKLKMNKEVVELEEVDRVEQLPASNRSRGEMSIQTSLQYGYIRAKMIRVKMLHQFLWLQVFESNNSSANDENVSAIIGQAKTNFPEEMTEKEKRKLNELTNSPSSEKKTPKTKKNRVRDPNALLTNLVGSAFRATTETLSQSNDNVRNKDAMEVEGEKSKSSTPKKGKEANQTDAVPVLSGSLTNDADNSTIDLDDFGSFQVHDVLSKMPIDLYLQIIGSTKEIPELDDLRDQNVTFGQVPDHVKQILMRKRYSFKRLALLLDTLKRLGLVISSITRDEDAEAASVVALQTDAPAFYLTRTGRIKDTAKVPPETRVYRFDSLADVMRYWSELEYIALHRVLEHDEAESGEEGADVQELAPSNSTLPPEVLVRYNWTGLNVLTNYQKKILNDNKEAVARDNDELEKVTLKVQEVAKKSRLSPQQVLMYYKKVKLRALKRARTVAKKREGRYRSEREELEDELEDLKDTSTHKKKGGKKKTATDDDEMSVEDGANTSKKGSNPLFGGISRPQRPSANQRPNIAIRFDGGQFGALRGAIESATPGENQAEYVREEEDEYDAEEEQQVHKTRVRPTRKVFWNSDEDFIILKHYTVQRADNPNLGPQDDVDWSALANIIHKPPEACKKRLKYLMRFNQCQRAVQAAIEQRHKQQSNSVKDASDMSALSSALTTLEKQSISFDLPKYSYEFQRLFDVEPVQKQELQLSPAANSVLADFLKCILMVPEEEYLPEAAYKFLSNFDRDEITKCFEVLRKDGIIIQNKSYAGAPKSSRGFKISFKYQQLFGKPIAEQLIHDAVELEQRLSSQNEEDELIIQVETAPSGGTVHQTILNLLRQNIHPEISIEEVEPMRRRWKSSGKEAEAKAKGKKGGKNQLLSPKGKKKKTNNNNNNSIDEDNESENEGEKSSVHELESDASDDEDEGPQMRNYLLSEIRVPEVRAEFVKRKFPDAIVAADDDEDDAPVADPKHVTPVTDDRGLIPPKISTWAECAEFLRTIPYLNTEPEADTSNYSNNAPTGSHTNNSASAARVNYLSENEISVHAKSVHQFIEAAGTDGIADSVLLEKFSSLSNLDKLTNALHMSGIIERVTGVHEYAWVERKYVGRWSITPYKIIKSRDGSVPSITVEKSTESTNNNNVNNNNDDNAEGGKAGSVKKRKRAGSVNASEGEPKKKRARTSSRITEKTSADKNKDTTDSSNNNNNNNTNVVAVENDSADQTEKSTKESEVIVPARKSRMLQEVVAFAKDTHVVLYPWIKFDGSVDNATLSRLKRNVFSIVHQNPGITEDKLLEKATMFRPGIIKQLIELLLDTKVVYTRSISVTRSTLFGEDVRIEAKICYFPSPDFAVLLQDM